LAAAHLNTISTNRLLDLTLAILASEEIIVAFENFAGVKGVVFLHFFLH